MLHMQSFERTRESVSGDMVGNRCSIIFAFSRWVGHAEVITDCGSAFSMGETSE